jgi:hypothetical protein
MNLKKLYGLSLVGWGALFFGLGWVVLTQIINLQFGTLSMIGIGSLMFGLGIVIATLKSIKSIEFEVEHV